MRLYTRKGDDGRTSLLDGSRVPKDNPRITACGHVDELNSLLGWCRCSSGDSVITGRLEQIQPELFTIGAELAMPPSKQPLQIDRVSPAQNKQLETWIDEACAATTPLTHFVLPGGCELAARLHVARTVCRRAERAVIRLHELEPIPPDIIVYLNRLSDLLFAWARLANQEAGVPDVLWIPNP